LLIADFGINIEKKSSMKMRGIASRSIKKVGYDKERRILLVEFHNGHLYEYRDFPASTYADFIASTSRGAYFNKYIRDHYSFHRIDTDSLAA
jgi:hypothetical protein